MCAVKSKNKFILKEITIIVGGVDYVENQRFCVSDTILNVDKHVDKYHYSVDNPLFYPQLSTEGVIPNIVHKL